MKTEEPFLKVIIKITIVNIIGLIIITSASCSGDSSSLTVSGWKILSGDACSIDEIKDQNKWTDAVLPLSFRITDPGDDRERYIWLKAEFDVVEPDMYHGISIGRINLPYRIYINGIEAGGVKYSQLSFLTSPENFNLPKSVLKKRSNKVLICIVGSSGKRLNMTGSLMLLGESNFERSRVLNSLIYREFPLSMAILFFTLAIIQLIAFYYNGTEKVLLFNSLALLTLVVYILALLAPNSIIDCSIVKKIDLAASSVFSILVILIVQSLYRIYLTEYNRFIILLFFLIAAVNAGGVLSHDHYIGRMLSLFAVVLFFVYLVFTISILSRLNTDKMQKRDMIIFGSLFTFLVVFETVSGLTGGSHSDLLTIYFPPVFVVIFTSIFAKNIMKNRIELETVYSRLKNKSQRNRNSTVTGNTEEKLKEVVELLKENYMSNISREGLAAAIGMNPNYMGEQFKIFTGEKINDYINRLRIEEAKKHLADKEKKVIDIALSVGFESLVTFNRAFKNMTGITPTEYRNSNRYQ